jgi:hypothetical protein
MAALRVGDDLLEATLKMVGVHGGEGREQVEAETRRVGRGGNKIGAYYGRAVDGNMIDAHQIVTELKYVKTLGDMIEASGNKIVAKKSMRAMGEIVGVCCFGGALTPAVSAEVAMQKWWAKVSSGAPMA